MGVSSEFVKRHRHTHASISCFALCVDLAYPCNYDWSFLEGTYKKHRFPLLRFAQADYPSSSQEQVLSRVGWYCELKLTWTRMVLQLSNSKGTKHCWSLANADCNTCSIKVENQWVNRHNFESIMSIMFLWGLSLSSWSHHVLCSFVVVPLGQLQPVEKQKTAKARDCMLVKINCNESTG